jgi:hypothetical protein
MASPGWVTLKLQIPGAKNRTVDGLVPWNGKVQVLGEVETTCTSKFDSAEIERLTTCWFR